MYERENILRIFKKTKEAVERGDSAEIKNLSDQTTNSASLTNDPDNIAAAVMVYSLSKIIERENYKRMEGWKKFYRTYLDSIDKIIDAVEKQDDKTYREEIRRIRREIENLSGKLKENIQDVFNKASINKASRIYEHGISMERTARLLGVNMFELASYAGGKSETPYGLRDVSVNSRIKLIERFFENEKTHRKNK